ncbi:MAG: CDP-diacylglycerol--glycerol-3-phosphate 3-phosphatidyltransferase [Proteobacteria bacterium]|nr:CDP-diacylglycerol--glycerol-3-phosphate 3-phosphatidyltransferase [Pseudomonadota bacterium]
MNIPNYFTVFRIALIPLFVLMFYLPFSWSYIVCATLFAIACLTDWLDGYLARTLHQVSRLGTFLDPVADKLVVVTALVMLVGSKHLPYIAIPAAIIIGREIVVSALREWMAEIGKRTSVAVSYIGKFKTAIQMLSLFLLLLYSPQSSIWIGILGYSLLYIAAGLTLWSMTMYLKAAWPEINLR